MSNTYTCEKCGGTFEKARSDTEAEAEMAAIFGPLPPGEEKAVICEDCWRQFMEWFEKLTPEQRAEMDRDR